MKQANKIRKADGQQGFTLIELSIVLVIIGLIVGGVLVGQDLIKAAEIRATVSQYEKYNTAVNTFRTKFNGIPGDIAGASAFGIYNDAGLDGSAAGKADGNGLIEEFNVSAGKLARGETLVFWRHLSDSNLIDGNLGSDLTTNGQTQAAAAAAVPLCLPPAKIGRGVYFIAYAASGLNYYQQLGVTGITAATGVMTATAVASLTPLEAYNMDIKIDDGAPWSGTILMRDPTVSGGGIPDQGPGATYYGAANAGKCVIATSATDTTATYNRSIASTGGGNTPNCSLRMRFN